MTIRTLRMNMPLKKLTATICLTLAVHIAKEC